MPETAEHNVAVKRIPTCPENHRASIAEFLEHFRDRVERSLNDHRVAAMSNKSPSLLGQIRYFRNQLSTINWLAEMNASRRKQGAGDAD